MSIQNRNIRPDLVLDFILMYQCLIDFYSQPENQGNTSTRYEGCLWDKIFLHAFGVDPASLNDPLWDVLFTKYNAMTANDCVREELSKNESNDLQIITSQPFNLHKKVNT